MKTLKKSLCLILALVFVLGLCTFGAGAAFTDTADVNYKDAVSVMNGLGILKGYEDGSFQPAKTVTRAEAATMITKMILGETAAAKLPAASAFADVPADNWAAPYVNYCATKKIIVGYGDGNFGPNDPVTALQLAKMLLVACGYGQMGEFAPDTWEIYTFTYAVQYGVYDDVEISDFAAPASREECALYVFNTLDHVKLVKYDVDANDYTPKAETYGSKTFKLINTRVTEQYCYVTANADTGADYTVVEIQKASRVDAPKDFDNDFETVNIKFDTDRSFIGHQVQICYNSKELKDADGNKYYEAYLVEDVSTVVPAFFKLIGELTAALGSHADDTPGFLCFHNYEQVAYDPALSHMWIAYYYGSTFYSKANLVRNTEYSLINGNFIVDEDGDVLAFTDTAYTVAVVTAVEDDHIVVSNSYAYATEKQLTDVEIKNEFVQVEGVKKGDYVTVDFVGDNIYAGPTSTRSVTISQIGASNGFSMSSYQYTYDFNGGMFAGGVSCSQDIFSVPAPEDVTFCAPANPALGDFSLPIKIGDIVTFYFDKYGSFFAASIDESTKDQGYVFYVAKYTASGDGYNAGNYKAQCVDAAGNEVIYTLKDAAAYSALTTPGVYTAYTNDGYTTLNPVASSTDTFTLKGLGKDTKLGASKFLTDDLSVYYITDKTGGTGYLSNIKITKSAVLPTGSTTLSFYVTSAGEVPVIWILGGEPADFSASYIYVANKDSVNHSSPDAAGIKGANDATYYAFSLLCDGAATGSILVGSVIDASNHSTVLYPSNKTIASGFYQYAVDSYGVYTLKEVTNVLTVDLKTTGDAVVRNGKLYVDFKIGADNAEISEFDLSEVTICDLCGGTNSKGYATSVTTVDQLVALLTAGKTVNVSFAYAPVLGGYAPVSTIYINEY